MFDPNAMEMQKIIQDMKRKLWKRYFLNICIVGIGLSQKLLDLIKTFVRSFYKEGVIGLVVQKDSRVRVVAVKMFAH